MIKHIALFILLCPLLAAQSNQSVKGGVVVKGNRVFGSTLAPPGGAPLTYLARTDGCETSGTGIQPGCTGQPAMAFLGRSTSVGQVFSPTDVPPNLTTSGSPLLGLNKCAVDSDFHTKICRATDWSFNALGLGSSFSMGSGGDVQMWAPDHSAFLVVNSGGIYRMMSFDGATMATTPTVIGGIANAGCVSACTTFAGGDLSFSSTSATTLYEFDTSSAPAHYYVNQLTLVKPGAPSTWTFNRAHLYDFALSTHCLPSDFNPNWVGSFNVSSDDNLFVFAMSDHGQNGVRDATHYGATFLVAFDKRQGSGNNRCRVLKTFGTGFGPMTVDGDWGPLGSPLMGTDQQPALTDANCTFGNAAPDVCYPNTVPLGTSQGPVLPDAMYLHNGGPTSNNNYVVFSGSDINACTVFSSGPLTGRSSCYCKSGASPILCEAYTWEVATLNIRPALPVGHNVKGSLGSYKGQLYSFFTYHDPYIKLAPLLSISIPVDQHGAPSNLNNLDQQPVAFVSSQICGSGTGGGNQPCVTSYGQDGNLPYYNEFVMVENQAVYGAVAQHCPGPSACAYRMGHTFNSGTSWSFGIGNSIANISPDGQFALITTDWFAHSATVAGTNSGFGCTNGWDGMTAGQLCLNSLDSNGKGTLYPITAAHEDPSGTGKNVTFTSTMNPIVNTILTVKGFAAETRWNKDWTVLTSSPTSWTAVATVAGLADDAGGTANYDCANGTATQPCARGDIVVINLLTAGTVP